MINKVVSFLTDFKIVTAILAVFAVACGVATFIENDFGTSAARANIYNAKWFEIIMILLALSLIGNIYKFKLFRSSKLPILLFHLSFIVIILGAGITRYTGFEGMMHIREGDSSNLIVSDKTYLQIKVDDGNRQIAHDKLVFVNPLSSKNPTLKFKFMDDRISVKVHEMIYNAKDTLMQTTNGKTYIELISGGANGMESVFIEAGTTQSVNGMLVSFNDVKYENALSITSDENGLSISTTVDGTILSMDSQQTDVLTNNKKYTLLPRHLYRINDIPIVFKRIHENAALTKIPGSKTDGNPTNVIDLAVKHNDTEHNVRLIGRKGVVSPAATFKSGGLNFSLSYGSKYYRTPFHIHLNDFRMKRYPGSNSPSAYESSVTVYDKRFSDEGFDHLIFMNNVLNYDGYRFFQSSYDRDELGSVLSVNHDSWGTRITYLGYTLLILGMFLTPFVRKSRFQGLARKVSKLRLNREAVKLILILFSLAAVSNQLFAQTGVINAKHAEKFGELQVQDYSGRIKPINSLASEVIRKISGKTTYNDLSAMQIFLGMHTDPALWQQQPIIKIKHPGLKKKLGTDHGKAAFLDFCDQQFNYQLQNDVMIANRKKPAERNKYDKEILKVDERVNISYAIYSGQLLRIFPLKDDPNNTWLTFNDHQYYSLNDSNFVASFTENYFAQIVATNWSEANNILAQISSFQQQNGASVILPDSKVKAEILYNKLDLFNSLYKYYLLVGLLLLFTLFIEIFQPTKLSNMIVKVLSYGLIILFGIHTFGLGLRWYIGGYAPWSNAYESMIYIGWATVLSGMLFSRTSKMTLGATALLTSIILMVAHLNWLDPVITPLVPVLKSYWLMIHVAIITASYGFLALGGLLGFINLVLIAIKRKAHEKRIGEVIVELTHINEMTLAIGLFMATIGTFLGGVWANESWGRYWGWDPKETWALIIVLTYAIILHLRFFNKSKYLFNLTSVLGFGTVIMTYFGVNYFLSGLHSYAAGDPVPIPLFVYYALGVIGIVAIAAYWNNRKR